MDVVFSDGDLTQKLDIETGDELEVIASNINELLERMRTNMLAVRNSSYTINDSFKSFSADMNVAVDKIENISGIMKNMHMNMQQTNDACQDANMTTQDVGEYIVEIKNKTSRGYDFVVEIQEKSSMLQNRVRDTQVITKEKLGNISEQLEHRVELSMVVEK